jgi:hypothetical protein
MSMEQTHCGTAACSRRCFLKMSLTTAALVTPLAACRSWMGTKSAAAPIPGADPALGSYVDLARLRPRPYTRIAGAVVRLKPPYWLGWPGTSYDLEGHRKEYQKAFEDSARKVGVELSTNAALIESDEAANQFVAKIKSEKPDAVLISLQHLYSWGWCEAIANAGIPTIIFAPVGTAFTGEILRLSRRPGVCVVSSLETSGVEQAMRMVRAKRQMEETRLLVLAGDARRQEKIEGLGTEICYAPRSILNDTFAKTPITEEAHEIARKMRRGAKRVVEPTPDDLLNASRSFIAAKHILAKERANAITTDCLGMVNSKVVPTPPCMAASIFQDAGVTYGCEADVDGALSLMLTSYLFDRPGYMNDPVPETVKNRLVAAHCVSGTHLRGFDKPSEPYLLRTHSESNMGVAMQVLWPVGEPVTLLRFQGPKEIIVDTGTVTANVNTPPAGGCRTSVEIAMDHIEDSRDVLGFHQVVSYGNHRQEVEAFCQMYGINAIHSPEKRPVPAEEKKA